MADPTFTGEGTFEITASNGQVYKIYRATPEQAQTLANTIEEQVKTGNPQLEKVKMPYNAEVDYKNFDDGTEISQDNSYKPGPVNTFFTRLMSAGPFNFGDEIAAAGNAAIPGMASFENTVNKQLGSTSPEQVSMWNDGATGFWDAFQKNQQNYQQELNAGANLNPRADAAGNIAGAFAGAKGVGMAGSGALNVAANVAPKAVIPLVGAVEAQQIARPVTSAMAQSTAAAVPAGYVAGYGAGDTPENRKRGAGQGAMFGAVAGPVLGYVTASAGPRIKALWDTYRGQGGEKEAMQQIIRTLADDGFDTSSPAGVQALRNALTDFTGKPVTIADVGRVTRARTQQAIEQPNPGQQKAIDFITGRQAGAGKRLEQDIQENVLPPDMALGPNPLNVFSHNEDLVAARANNAAELKPGALYEPRMIPPDMSSVTHEPIVPPPLATYDEPVTVGGQPTLDLQPPAPVRTVSDPTGGVERTLGRVPPVAAAPVAEAPEQGLLRMLGGSPPLRPGPQPLDLDFISQMQAPEQAAIAREAEAAAAASAARKARLEELRGMSAERRAAAEAADRKQAEDLAFHENATQAELPLPEGGRRRGVDVSGPPAPTYVDKTPRMVRDPVLNRIISEDPFAQRALEGAVRQSQAERAQALAAGEDVSHIPEILAGQPLDYRSLDYLKRFMDKEVNLAYGGTSATGFTRSDAPLLEKTRNAIRDRAKAENPEYANYLNTYSDDSQLIRSLEEGQQFGGLQPEQIAAEQAARTPDARGLYQVGAARSMIEDVRGAPDSANVATRVAGSPEARDQIEALGLPEGNAEALSRAAAQERQFNLLPSGVNPKALPPDQVSVLSAAGNIYNPTSGFSITRAMTAPIVDRIKLLRHEQVNEALLSKVLTMGKEAQDDVILQLEQAGMKAKADKIRRVIKSRKQGLTTGLLIGGPVSLQEDQ